MSLIPVSGGTSSNARGFYPLTIDQSLRFNDNDSAYLSGSSASTLSTYTMSLWLKRGVISSGTYQYVFSYANSGLAIGSTVGNTDKFYVYNGSTITPTDGVYRDPSAWYHLVLSVTSNTGVLYINGESVKTGIPCASIGTTANYFQIGRYQSDGALYFDGYLAEVHFTDGTAYTADAFGEFKSGVWVAKAPSVTYGTNGFYLDFANSADIGNDVSGNNNDWTPNNFTASDVVLDSPTDNFATLNPLTGGSSTTSNGNLETTIAPVNGARVSTFAVNSGKWYCEMTPTTIAGYFVVGIGAPYSKGWNTSQEANAKSIGWSSSAGTLLNTGSWTFSSSTVSTTYTTNDVLGIALDMDSNTIEFFKNGSSVGSATISVDQDVSFLIGNSSGVSNGAGRANFGQLGFTYTPPTGYLALSTANLPDPVIDPAQDESPEDYFNTVLYSGNNTTQSITGVGFQPDWVWIKARNNTYPNLVWDVNRTASNVLVTDSTQAEVSYAGFTSFNSDGFSVSTNGGATGATNDGTTTYVAWNWKAGGTGVSNTDGTITSTVSANTESGFSIVGYTGNGTAGATVGHGLSSVPEMIIVKNRDATDAWQVYHASNTANPETDYLVLNTTAATADNLNRWNDTAPTTSVFSLGDGVEVNTNTEDYIAYAFHSVEGFSKFGSYTGNGSTDGPFVYCGFRPAFVMTKCSSLGSLWAIWDVARNTYNPVDNVLQANASDAEISPYNIDILSNGFKFRDSNSNWNGSGATFIFMAFAETPFRYSLAR